MAAQAYRHQQVRDEKTKNNAILTVRLAQNILQTVCKGSIDVRLKDGYVSANVPLRHQILQKRTRTRTKRSTILVL